MKRTTRKKQVKTKQQQQPIGFKKGFTPPDPEQCHLALGAFPIGISTPLAFDDSNNAFEKLRTPTHELDWLAQFHESPQSFTSWKRTRPYSRLSNSKDSLYLLYLNSSKSNQTEDDSKWLLSPLLEFVSLFLKPCFSEIGILPTVEIPLAGTPNPIKTRHSHRYHTNDYNNNHLQICVDDLVPVILNSFPSNARFTIGITMIDLHMDTTDEFTIGAASPNDHIGCFSFSRYDPNFDHKTRPKDWKLSPIVPEKERRSIMLGRCCKVLVHEVLHLLGFGHCVYYNCLMNGSGHISEDDLQPLRLCPVDLRKFEFLANTRLEENEDPFSIVSWYSEIASFFDKYEIFKEEATWIHSRISFINGDQSVSTTSIAPSISTTLTEKEKPTKKRPKRS